MSDLQNRLDQYQEPDFDRDALWDKIELPKKKRRRWILFLWLGLLMSFSMAGAYWLDSIDFISEKGPVDLDSYMIPFDEKVLENGLECGDVVIENQEGKKGDNPLVSTLIKNNISDPIENVQSIRPQKPDAGLINIVRHELSPQKPEQGLNTTNANQTSLTSKESLSLPKIIQKLEKLPTLPISLMDVDHPGESLTVTSDVFDYVVVFPRHELMFFGGLAGQFHQFKVENGGKIKLEKTMPGYYVGLQYKRRFNNVYYLLADAKYAFHQSEIDASDKQSLQLLSSSNEVTLIETTTYYSLYNQYYSLDLAIGVGIAQYIGDIEIALESSLGAAHWLKIDADYLDDNTVLQRVKSNEIRSTTIFGKLNISARKHLPSNILVGGNISAQTPLRVDAKKAPFQHQLLPFYIGVNIGKRF